MQTNLFEYQPMTADFTRDHKPLKAIHDKLVDMATKDNKRPLKANGSAGILVKGMLNGKFFTVQDAEAYLKAHGKISNDVAKRQREARHWLENNGYEIEEQSRATCVAWGIKQNLTQGTNSLLDSHRGDAAGGIKA